MVIVDPEYNAIVSAEAGDVVWDDLTHSLAKIVRYDPPVTSLCGGYWLDNDYLGGGRHPWEISPKPERVHSLY